MKTLILALALSGLAHAGTVWNYAAATDGSYNCPVQGNTCYGFTATGHTVEYVGLSKPANGPFSASISIDGVAYATLSTFTDPSVPFLVTARDNSGRTAWVTAAYNKVRVCYRFCAYHYDVVGGSVTLP